MKLINIIIYTVIIGLGAAAVVIGVVTSDNDSAYARGILQHRQEVADFLLQSPQSPIPLSDRDGTIGLRYYEPDRSYEVEAKLTLVATAPPLTLLTSADTEEVYYPHSHVVFELAGVQQRLLLLQSRESQASNRLFLAFTDETSGSETYAGGRYLDVYPQGEETVTIDFNLAYNPYCVYDAQYICPVPPPENRLTVPVHAGEKNYKL